MLKYGLSSIGKAIFFPYTVTWNKVKLVKPEIPGQLVDRKWVTNPMIREIIGTYEEDIISEAVKDSMVEGMTREGLSPIVTNNNIPTQEILTICESQTFNDLADLKAFLETGIKPLNEIETLALAVAELYETINGGAV